MNTDQFIQAIRKTKAQLLAQRQSDAILIGKESLALVRRRIQNTGEDSFGSDFEGYSDNPLPPFFFIGKSVNASGENRVRRAQKEGTGLSYKEFRQANNRRTDIVDLTFTGAMWREMDVFIQSNENTSTTVSIKPRTERSRKVAAFNSERYGNILRMSKNEISTIRKANLDRVLKIFQSNLK